jgi:hypothetical protein
MRYTLQRTSGGRRKIGKHEADLLLPLDVDRQNVFVLLTVPTSSTVSFVLLGTLTHWPCAATFAKRLAIDDDKTWHVGIDS